MVESTCHSRLNRVLSEKRKHPHSLGLEHLKWDETKCDCVVKGFHEFHPEKFFLIFNRQVLCLFVFFFPFLCSFVFVFIRFSGVLRVTHLWKKHALKKKWVDRRPFFLLFLSLSSDCKVATFNLKGPERLAFGRHEHWEEKSWSFQL